MNVPPVVRSKALAAGAEQWLRDLSDIIATVERDWSITVGRPYDDPTEAFVAEATLSDGTPAVLKLLIPRVGNHSENETTVLRLTNGDGCVRLLRDDPTRSALLLERLGRSLVQLRLPLAERHEILCSTAARVWRPAPGCGLPTGAEKARWLMEFITRTWEELDHPCSERAVDHALACAAQRLKAHDDERAVLVHGDVHQWNTLESANGFKLVDPDGLLAEAEYDLGIVMREDPVELLDGDPRERARWLAGRCGLSATAIWQWGVVERVSTGLLGTTIGMQPVAAEMLAAADQIAISAFRVP
jgi:streptomycin 6-kinase